LGLPLDLVQRSTGTFAADLLLVVDVSRFGLLGTGWLLLELVLIGSGSALLLALA
jgi:hypothetical protein